MSSPFISMLLVHLFKYFEYKIITDYKCTQYSCFCIILDYGISMKLILNYCSLFLFFLLSNCAFFSSSSNKPHGKQALPKAPANVVPEGSGDNWRYIGTTNDGFLAIEINNNSIIPSKNTSEVFSFEDRKTVIDQSQFTYPNGQPHFKYLLNSWQMDCQNKKYILSNAKMYNQTGTLLGSYDYANNDNVKWLGFGTDSIAELEYKFICLNQNRNLGY